MTDSLERAQSLLAEHPLIDGHNDLPWELRQQVSYDLDRLDIAAPQPTLQTDIPRLREGRVGGQFWSVYVPCSLEGDGAVVATLEQIDAVRTIVKRYPDVFGIATTADEVEQVFASGRIASLLGMEGGHSIAGSLAALRSMYALGVRYMTLTHNDNTPWADSATDIPVHNGLSEFGREVVREMNRLGMLVDLSHVSADTMRMALSIAQAPVIFSHSSARTLVNMPRNVPDDVLARLPENGGVCMVAFVPEFVVAECAEWRARAMAAAEERGIKATDMHVFMGFQKEYARTHPKPRGTLDHIVDHIEHVRAMAGVDHVGLGGDYDGTDVFPEGMDDVSGYPRLIAALLDRGWSEEDCGKLAGGNVLRALRTAESVADHKGLAATL